MVRATTGLPSGTPSAQGSIRPPDGTPVVTDSPLLDQSIVYTPAIVTGTAVVTETLVTEAAKK